MFYNKLHADCVGATTYQKIYTKKGLKKMSENKRNDRQVKINDDAKEFAKATLKRFKKQNKGYFDSKEEMKDQYSEFLLERLPGAIDFCVRYGHLRDNENVQEVKAAIYTKINDPSFIKLIKKEIKHGNDIDNIKLFPIIAREILQKAKEVNDQILAEDPNGRTYDVSDVSELSKLIMKKKLSKLEKAGVSTATAFDVLSVVPTKKAIEYSQFFRIKSIYDYLYEHAKNEEINFAKIMDIVIPEAYYPAFITFALLERKEKFSKLTDNQKALYLAISTWCFDTMNNRLTNKELDAVIRSYVNSRKNDEAKGKDGNRRYALASLSEDEYERIAKTVKNLIAHDDSMKKYLN